MSGGLPSGKQHLWEDLPPQSKVAMDAEFRSLCSSKQLPLAVWRHKAARDTPSRVDASRPQETVLQERTGVP